MDENVKNAIDESVLCWLATVDSDGMPNVSPKELFTYDDEDCLVIANVASPKSLRNIKSNPKVSIGFVQVFRQKGFKLKGIATIINKSDPVFDRKAKKLKQMAGDAFPFHSLTSVRVEQVNPILAPSYQFYPDTQEVDQIQSALRTYKVRKWIKASE